MNSNTAYTKKYRSVTLTLQLYLQWQHSVAKIDRKIFANSNLHRFYLLSKVLQSFTNIF